MLDGPYPPRVVPAAASSGSDAPSAQRVGTQWSRVAPAPVAGLQLTAPTPCGIPWGRLYHSDAVHATEPEDPLWVERDHSTDGEAHRRRFHPSLSAAAAASTGRDASNAPSSLFYRPSYFDSAYSPPPPPQQQQQQQLTGAMATVSTNSSVFGHHYHSDETPPLQHTQSPSPPPSSVLAFGAVAGSRYRQMAAEHQYGTAATPAAAAAAASSSSLLAASKALKTESPQRGFRDRTSKREEEKPQSSSEGRAGTQHRWRTPFSDRSDAEKIAEEAQEEERSAAAHRSRAPRSREPQVRSSSRTVTVTPAATTAPSNVAVVSADERSETEAEEKDDDDAAASSRGRRSGSSSVKSSHAHTRNERARARASLVLRQPPPHRGAPPPPQRTRSGSHAGPRPAGGASASPRTAQWAVKLIDELVAQVAVQQASATTGLVTASSPSLSTGPSMTGRAVSRNHSSMSHANGVSTTTVADLTTSFLSSRYGALQWRPMLQDLAVCLHRYHAVSPACAVFREYFIHVDADTLDDFYLFCRLFGTADIPHCSTVEVRRVALTADGHNSRSDAAAAAAASRHTIVPRRYVEAREVVDRLQRTLQRVVLTDTASCVVVGEKTRRPSRGAVPRYARGPPARMASVPRRRRLTADEVRAVKKVVVAWLEESMAAERDARDASDEDEEADSSISEQDREKAAPSLRHIAFDRPGRVDAYALLQATLEAVRLICRPARGESGAEGVSPRRGVAQEERRSTSSGSEDEEEIAEPTRLGHSPKRRPSWQAASSFHSQNHKDSHSPLVRQVLASPPRGYAYPVEADVTSPSVPRRREARLSQPQQHTSHADDYRDDEDEGDKEEWEEGNIHSRIHRSRDREPSYRQPRANAAPAAAAAHRAPDGRLWSPPRDGVLARSGGQPRRDSVSRHPPHSPAADQSGSYHESPRPSSRERRPRGYDTSHTEDDDAEIPYDIEMSGEAGMLPRRGSSSARGRRTSLGRPPRSATSSPSRPSPPHPQQPQPAREVISPPPGRHAYVADLHAERRWQQVQRQVAAAERRDACWRQHPRMQARLQQQQRRDSSAVDATIQDIDKELQRRAQSHYTSPLSKESEYSRSGEAPTQDVMYLRNPQEAAVFAGQHVRLLPPPALPPSNSTAAPRVVPSGAPAAPQVSSPQHPSLFSFSPSAERTGGIIRPAVAGPTSTAGLQPPPSATTQHIRIERITPAPPTSSAAATAAAAGPAPPHIPSAGLRFADNTAVTKETVFLTDEEQAMLDQLEVALRRLDTQHRRDHAATVAAEGRSAGSAM